MLLWHTGKNKTCWTVIIYLIQLYYFFLFNFLFLIKRVMVYRYGYKHWIRHPSFLMEMGYPFFKCCNWWQLGGDGMDTWLPWCLWPLSMVVSFLVWPYMYCLSRITSIDISCFQSYFFYFWKNDKGWYLVAKRVQGMCINLLQGTHKKTINVL